MAAESLDSKYDRAFAVFGDKYGIDPLKDKVLPRLKAITVSTNHVVSQDERGAPDLIALRQYGSEKLYWIIMAYNGIASYRSIIEGTTLRIPSLGAVTDIITENAIAPNRVERVIPI